LGLEGSSRGPVPPSYAATTLILAGWIAVGPEPGPGLTASFRSASRTNPANLSATQRESVRYLDSACEGNPPGSRDSPSPGKRPPAGSAALWAALGRTRGGQGARRQAQWPRDRKEPQAVGVWGGAIPTGIEGGRESREHGFTGDEATGGHHGHAPIEDSKRSSDRRRHGNKKGPRENP